LNRVHLNVTQAKMEDSIHKGKYGDNTAKVGGMGGGKMCTLIEGDFNARTGRMGNGRGDRGDHEREERKEKEI